MSFDSDKDRRRKPGPASDVSEDQFKARRKRAPRTEVGQALRAAYQQAVSEDIPPEMLDLLGKLG